LDKPNSQRSFPKQPLAAAIAATAIVVGVGLVCCLSIIQGDRRAFTIYLIAGIVLVMFAANWWRIFFRALRAKNAAK
jgi:hypothetical protein